MRQKTFEEVEADDVITKAFKSIDAARAHAQQVARDAETGLRRALEKRIRTYAVAEYPEAAAHRIEQCVSVCTELCAQSVKDVVKEFSPQSAMAYLVMQRFKNNGYWWRFQGMAQKEVVKLVRAELGRPIDSCTERLSIECALEHVVPEFFKPLNEYGSAYLLDGRRFPEMDLLESREELWEMMRLHVARLLHEDAFEYALDKNGLRVAKSYHHMLTFFDESLGNVLQHLSDEWYPLEYRKAWAQKVGTYMAERLLATSLANVTADFNRSRLKVCYKRNWKKYATYLSQYPDMVRSLSETVVQAIERYPEHTHETENLQMVHADTALMNTYSDSLEGFFEDIRTADQQMAEQKEKLHTT
jgi:hypothetical protein